MEFYVLYDSCDYPICVFGSLLEFSIKFDYEIREIRRKFNNTNQNFVNLLINHNVYVLYKFKKNN